MATPPEVRVDDVTRIFDDGNHNAFTDLCRYRDRIYLAFRSCPDGHGIFASSSIVVRASTDGSDWDTVFRFSVPGRDTRDPHFLIHNDRLFVYTGTWLCDAAAKERRDINDHLSYATVTDDGQSWTGPHMLEGTYGHYIWRAAAFAGKAYLCGRRRHQFAVVSSSQEGGAETETAMLESDDGFIWRFNCLFKTEYGDETAFLFESDGAVLALARDLSGGPAQICRSRPPFEHWTRTDLDRPVGGPLLARWGDHILVGGRKHIKDGPSKTTLYWLIDDQLREITELPSGGDNSYPGFLQTGPGSALVSYYSSHEGSGTSLPPSAI